MAVESPQRVWPSVSVIVPTYREAENLPALIERIGAVRAASGLDIEVLIMDDDSRDGTVEVVAGLALDWVRLCVRTRDRGLSAAVMDGFKAASHDVLLVMDADLSHPPEKIPEMLQALEAGADFVIGSRYAPGGSTAEDWGLFRWVNSKVATLLARPFTTVRDPMSGFFAFRRQALEMAAPLNPVGYKIGLEVIVKCGFAKTAEVPIHFSDRFKGESKLNLKEQLRYLQHLRRLAVFKYGDLAHFAQFAIVGATGTIVNLAVVTLFWLLDIDAKIGVAVAIGVAMLSNFVLNRQFTFSYARRDPLLPQLVGFLAGSSIGAVINYAVVLGLLNRFPALEAFPQAAAFAGILAGLVFNYGVSRYIVFRKS
ncbi:MAG: glycosyltransferase [Candidatus Hydrogenedens sp.]|nr:glycosyltransferase [Candidatus Hydrogenedens sp.]